jgi:uncharacterized protein (TIGR03067 family)
MNATRFLPRTLALATTFLGLHMLSAAVEPGFVPLFNGTDLAGWDGNPKFWSVKDGAITGQTTADNPTKGNTFIVWKDGTPGDFELRLQFRMVGGNSGIQYRSKVMDAPNWGVGGYQADFEAGPTYSGILYEERGRGILAERGQMVWIQPDGSKRVVGSLGKSEDIQSVIKKEDWNHYTILARGNHLTHIINDRVTVDIVDDQADKAARSGVLALQLHAGPPMLVQFRDIRLRTLAAAGQVSLDGVYKATQAVMNGDDLPEGDLASITVTFKGNTYAVEADGFSDSGTYTVDSSKSPALMDFKPTNGPAAGSTVKGIVSVEGDTVKLCYAGDGGARPEKFESSSGSGRVCMTFKKK